MHSEMGPVRQNSIQRTVRTAHLSVLMTVQCCLSEERGWLSDNGVAHINEITLSRSRLVQGLVTVSGFNSRCGTFISVGDQPPRSTQPGHPFVGRRNEYQPKGGDALRLGRVKAGVVRVWVAGKTV